MHGNARFSFSYRGHPVKTIESSPGLLDTRMIDNSTQATSWQIVRWVSATR